MKLLKGIGMAFCLVVLCLVVAPKTRADEQASIAAVTFAVPVEVPGVSAQILPAGTYRFMTLESTADRDIIQISSPDGAQVFTTMIGIPNSRLKAPDLIGRLDPHASSNRLVEWEAVCKYRLLCPSSRVPASAPRIAVLPTFLNATAETFANDEHA
jgi:hypothetical protein